MRLAHQLQAEKAIHTIEWLCASRVLNLDSRKFPNEITLALSVVYGKIGRKRKPKDRGKVFENESTESKFSLRSDIEIRFELLEKIEALVLGIWSDLIRRAT